MEAGYPSDKWASSCMDLIKNRITNSFLNENSIKKINVLRIWKTTNKINRILYDNKYDMYIEQFNKFGDDTKYYDYLFMYCESQNLQEIMKTIFNDFHRADDIKKDEKSNKNKDNDNEKENFYIFSTHLDKSEIAKLIKKNRIPNSNDRYYTVICKCIIMDELVYKYTMDNIENSFNLNGNNNNSNSNANSNTFSENTFEDLIEIGKNHNFSNKSILEISNLGKDKKIFIIKNRFLFIPEYIIEYNYIFNNKKIKNSQNEILNQNLNLNTDNNIKNSPVKQFTKFININNNKSVNININNNILLSSYNFLREGKSTDFNSEFIKNFNSSLKYLINSEVQIFLNKKNVIKNSSCNFQFFDEFETTEIFFAKYSIFNYINHCYKFLNREIFVNELDKIKDNLINIRKAPIKNPLIIKNIPLANNQKNLYLKLNSSIDNDNYENSEENYKNKDSSPKKNDKFNKLNSFKIEKNNKANTNNNSDTNTNNKITLPEIKINNIEEQIDQNSNIIKIIYYINNYNLCN
jgi:hypothetical protein